MGFKLGSQRQQYASNGVIKNKLRFGQEAGDSHISIPGENIIRTNLGEISGMACNDGNIYINEKIPPGSLHEQQTLLEEMKHMTDMKTGKLKYDDNYICYKGEKFERNDGKIKYKGKMYTDGDPRLPWEKDAKLFG
mgnify:CR=1 FL=1|jgi:hypothetical protein